MPEITSTLVTVIDGSEEQASEIERPSPSSAATDVTAAGADDAEHPSMNAGAIDPVITGAELSMTLMV